MTQVAKEMRFVLRGQFFELLFGNNEGYFCIATTHPDYPKATFKQKFFKWPDDFEKTQKFIADHEKNHNVYFCINLLKERERTKVNCLPTDLLWADLDEADPKVFEANSWPEPSTIIESSPGRYQAFWRLSIELEPFLAEEYSKRIAYATGADKSGWDLTQLFRVPYTKNFKYGGGPEINVVRALDVRAKPILFDTFPRVVEESATASREPGNIPPPEAVLYKYAPKLDRIYFTSLYTDEPEGDRDWSAVLWRLIHVCFEVGMSAEEVFSIADTAKCNKYYRDGRPKEHLWRDVLKAEVLQQKTFSITGGYRELTMPTLVEEPASETFIDKYRDWAEESTDAVVDFHNLCCAIMLSAVIANSVRLETSYGQIVPNLWGLILGDSTLTRKTTAMKMATDLLLTLDPNIIMGSDGSTEGLLTGLSERPNRVSVFYKDEVSGFFESINRKDYLAGMPETLTGLYDVPTVYTRRLRKEVIRIESPIFIFFGGGVREKVYDSLKEEYVLSGFLPRFLVVSGDTNLERLRRTGPANVQGSIKKAEILSRLADMYELYCRDVEMILLNQKVKMPARVMAELTPEAWQKYGDIEELLQKEAQDSVSHQLALPTFERLSRSMLKLAIILGATRQNPTDPTGDSGLSITITEDDIINAAWLIQDWGRFSVELVLNAGKKVSEKLLEKIEKLVAKQPGILRSDIGRRLALSKRELDDVLGTLEDRQILHRERVGNGHKYFTT